MGEPETSAQADSRELNGSIKSVERATYRVHEISLPSGTVVREFVGLDGNVFAVAWRGRTIPNLRQMLGRYFEPYVAAAKLHPGDRNHLQIEHADFIVHAAGHMRSFSGQAYLPQALPAGVAIGDLR